jgi:predicted  nucleic acid-binding Zn-ribbon protein
MDAMKGKLKLQQQELVALRESHTQMEQKFQDREDKRDKELAIVLRKVNRHFEQIHSLGKEIHRSHPGSHVQHETTLLKVLMPL